MSAHVVRIDATVLFACLLVSKLLRHMRLSGFSCGHSRVLDLRTRLAILWYSLDWRRRNPRGSSRSLSMDSCIHHPYPTTSPHTSRCIPRGCGAWTQASILSSKQHHHVPRVVACHVFVVHGLKHPSFLPSNITTCQEW